VSEVSRAEADDDSGNLCRGEPERFAAGSPNVLAAGSPNVLAVVVSTPLAAPLIAARYVLIRRVESCPDGNADH
jgi:hypothetical protein